MQTLLEFIKKYYYWLLFLGLEAFSLVLLFQFNSYQGSVWYTSANHVVGAVQSFRSEAISYLHLKDVNNRLTRDNLFLQQQVTDLREQLAERDWEPNGNDQIVADSLRGFTTISAKVVSSSLEKAENFIVIDKGSEDGVKADMGVVGGGGVVGIVYQCSGHYALVLPTINIKSSISCHTRHSNYFGNLQWTGGSTCTAYLSDIPHYAKVNVGDYVETSGYSAVFPSGIFVGRVKSIANSPDGLSLQLKVNLSTNFANLRDVQVLSSYHRAELDTLRNAISTIQDNNK